MARTPNGARKGRANNSGGITKPSEGAMRRKPSEAVKPNAEIARGISENFEDNVVNRLYVVGKRDYRHNNQCNVEQPMTYSVEDDLAMKNSLIIFTRDEVEGIIAIFPKIPLSMFDEVITMDGHSTDGTVEFLEGHGIKVVQQEKLGRGNATIEGVKRSSGENVVLLSADGNEAPEDIPKLLDELKECDIAVASRFMKGGRSDDSDDPIRVRKLGNLFFTLLTNLIWHADVTDATNGLRAFKRSAWDRLNIDSAYHEAEFQMTIRAAKLGIKIGEVPTIEGQRVGGKRYASTLKMGWTFTKFLFKELLIGRKFVNESGEGMKRAVREHYDQISSFYERRKRDAYLNLARREVEKMDSKRIVDLGCGTGLALSWMSGERVGVEIAPKLLASAHKGPDYIVGDIENLPLRIECCDGVISFDVLEHVPSLCLVSEAYRILVRGGKLLMDTVEPRYGPLLEVLERLKLKLPEGPHKWRSREEVLSSLKQAGFEPSTWTKPPINFYSGIKR
jgi:glycosyltransferase involved in cell wall biosynthesis